MGFKILARVKRVLGWLPPNNRGTILVAATALLVLLGLATFRVLIERNSKFLNPDPADIVILLTLDGVRPYELFRGQDELQPGALAGQAVMPGLMNTLLPQGTMLGNRERGSHFSLGNPSGVSMTGYLSILAGRPTICSHNSCLPLWGDSLLSRMAPENTALFTGFGSICSRVHAEYYSDLAVCGYAGARAFARSVSDFDPNSPSDSAVFRSAFHVLRTRPPRLLYIGLTESDTVGHTGDYAGYLRELQRYDGYILALAEEMHQLRREGRKPLLLVTTDHGRGNGEEWMNHSWRVRGTNDLWLFAYGHGMAATGMASASPARSQFDIRPTLEYALGLRARDSMWGSIMTELFAPGP